jgi:hypothetical protein
MTGKPILNPFIAGGPIPPEIFFGREGDIRVVLGTIVNGQGSCAIHGEPRIGKTSLLHYLKSTYIKDEWRISSNDFTFIFFDCAGVSGKNGEYRKNFWRMALAEVKNEAENRRIKRKVQPLTRRTEPTILALQELFREIAKLNHRLVILLDEFENVVETDPDLLKELRAFIVEKDISLVLSTHKVLPQVVGSIDIGGGVSFDRPFQILELKSFSKIETMRFIEERLKGQTNLKGRPIQFSQKDRDFIWEISQGHPFKIQFACHKLFEDQLGPATQMTGDI